MEATPIPEARPEPQETVDIRRHQQLTAGLFAVLLGVEVSVGLLSSQLVGAILLAFTLTLAVVVIRGQWLSAREMERAGKAFATEQVAAVYRDAETGLPTRNQLLDDLVREIARAERFNQHLTLAVVDVERMDDLTALWGQDFAVRAAVHLAETLKRVARTSDVLARIDTRRFAVLLASCDEPQAHAFAERLRMAVTNRPIRSSERMKVPVYIDVVVSTLPYVAERYRGPLEFLSVAGGETVPENAADRRVVAAGKARDDVRGLRRTLLEGSSLPDGRGTDYAEAYREHRGRRAG